MVLRIVRIDQFKTACFIGVLTVALLMLASCAGTSTSTASPLIRPASGTYKYVPVLTIEDVTAGASIYYTTDGSTPTTSSTLYSGSTLLEVTKNETVNAIAVAGNSTSSVTSATYTINLPPAPTPVLSLAPGAYLGVQTVTVTDAAIGATIYYTTDGTTPTSSSTAYTGPISVASSESLQLVAISQAYGYGYSAVAGGLYAILSVPTFSLSSGTYSSTQSLTLSVPTPGASIYYTTNGSVPTASSTLYAGPITVASSEIVNAIATIPITGGSGSLTSADVANTYIIHLPGATVLSGTALGGKPIVGATVQLYQIGAGGYGAAATPLMSPAAVTNSTGSVTLAGSYSCTHGTYLYLTASGGTAVTGQTANPNLALATIVGLCDNLTANSSFTLNEQTTVAAAYALAQFSSGTTFGTTQTSKPGSGSSAPADNFATSSTNIVGLANAMSIAQILVSNATGSVGSNANNTATPEWWQLNLISNMLAACDQSAGGTANDGSACGKLFGNVTATGGAAPADTLQAALDLALAPTLSASHIASLYNLVSSSSPFQPYPASASLVYDFSIGISYTPASASGNLLMQPQAVSIDSLGNAWIGNQPTGSSAPYPASLVELTPTGIPIQAGATSGKYVINSYALSSTPTVSTTLGGQYSSATNIAGLFAPSIDTNNNVWMTDRQKSNMAMLSGSGTTYSSSYSYQNGGNALDSGGKGAVGYALNAGSYPTSVYLDGSNNVWFMMEGTVASGGCSALSTPLTATTYTEGITAFLGENPSNVATGKNGNTITTSSAAYLTIDPGKNDKVTISGTSEPISGSPFVWFAGVNTGINLLVPNFTQAIGTATPNGGVPYPSCETFTAGSSFGEADDTAAGETYWKTATVGNATDDSPHSQAWVTDIPDPNLSGDYLHDIGMVEDQTWDNAGHLWVANGHISTFSSDNTPINTIGATTPAAQINAAISRITTSWGTGSQGTSGTATIYSPTTNGPSNFTFSVFHNQSGLFDGSTVANVPEYITTDGGGNVYFATSSDNYVNAITNSGVALTQVSGSASSPTTGFIGSICTSCTNNGTTATYQRANSYTLSRPTIDQSGNIWVPLQGSGSNSIYLLVGVAVPRVQPDSVGLKNGTFASLP